MHKALRFLALMLLIGGIGGLGPTVEAGTLPSPTGKVILRVTGNIANRNAPDAADFDAEMLERLGIVEVVTHTPWTEGEVRFSGVSPKALLDAVGASGDLIEAIALNDYRVKIPTADFERYPTVLAMRVDGQRLRIRDKGPLWLVYPWRDHPEIDTIEYHSRSIWQVKSLNVH
jgi:hypothetical protein